MIETFPFGYKMIQWIFNLFLNPSIAALPVSPEVAPRIVIEEGNSLFIRLNSKKYSNKFPRNCNAISLNEKVGP